MAPKCYILISCILILIHIANCKRILLLSSQITSHILEQKAISGGLIKNGHEVYAAISSSYLKGRKALYPGVKPLYYQCDPSVQSIDDIVEGIFDVDNWTAMWSLSEGTTLHCSAALEDEQFRKQITELKFDLAIVDGFILNFCNFLLPHIHGVPYVFMFSHIHPWMASVPALPSFAPISPHHGNLMLSDKMSFMERVQNLMWYIILMKMTPFPGRNDLSLLQTYAPDVSSWEDLVYRSSLFIETRDHILETPQVSLPNVIHTPGITYGPPQPLPDDLYTIMENADSGVIIISFGSVAGNFPQQIMDKLIAALNQLDQIIIARFYGKSLEQVKSKVNSNVHVFEWLPQNDLLGHRNTKLFVTHCGNNGQYEAVYHAVPMVGLPIFGEQRHNAFRMERHGYGVSLLPDDMFNFKSKDLVEAIEEVWSNPKYENAVKKASTILKDVPMNPVETATYWIEHIMKHGSSHLISEAVHMPWYKLLMIDMILFIVTLLSFVLFIALKIIMCIIHVCREKYKAKRE